MLFPKFSKIVSLVASVGLAAIATASAAELTTYQLVTRIFENKCYSCHSAAKKHKSGLTLDTYEALLEGGEEGIALVPGSLEKSYISKYILLPADDDLHMPPPKKEQLEKEEIAIINAWIKAGGSPDQKLAESPLDKDLQTWAIVNVINKVVVPKVAKAPVIPVPPTFERDIAKVESLIPNSIWHVDESGHLLSFSAVNIRDTMDDTKLAALIPLAPYLVDIDLSRTKVTALGLQKFLQKAKLLESLNLSGTKVGSDWIPAPAALPALKHLVLYGTPLGTTAVNSISGLKTLETLYVAETGISAEDLEKLRESIPDTTGDDYLTRQSTLDEKNFPKSTPGLKAVGQNLALNKPVTATSSYNMGAETFPAAKLTDGLSADTGTPGNWSFWLADDNTKAAITIDLQKPEAIALIELENTRNRKHGDRALTNFTIETSTDGVTFKKLTAGTLQAIATKDPASYVSEKFPVTPTTARYLRLQVESYVGNGPGLNEIRIFSGVEKATKP